VLNALLQIEMGNPEPLRNLVDGCNTDLRGRLVKLSEEGAFMISSDSDTGLVYDFRAATISERADGKETAEPPDDLNMVFREIGDALSAVFDPTQAFSEEPQADARCSLSSYHSCDFLGDDASSVTSDGSRGRMSLGSSGRLLLTQARAREAATSLGSSSTDHSGFEEPFMGESNDLALDGLDMEPPLGLDAIDESMIADMAFDPTSFGDPSEGNPMQPLPGFLTASSSEPPPPVRSPARSTRKGSRRRVAAQPPAPAPPASAADGIAPGHGSAESAGDSWWMNWLPFGAATFGVGHDSMSRGWFASPASDATSPKAAPAKRVGGKTKLRSTKPHHGRVGSDKHESLSAELLRQADRLTSMGGLVTPRQRQLVAVILSRAPQELLQKFGTAFEAAERGNPKPLHNLLSVAEKLSRPRAEEGERQPKLRRSSFGSTDSISSMASAQSHTSNHSRNSLVSRASLQSFDALDLEIADLMGPALRSSNRAALNAGIAKLEEMALQRRARAFELREANQIIEAMQVMRELKRIEASADKLKDQASSP